MELILQIDDTKAPFFLELIRNFDFVKVESPLQSPPEQIEFIADLKQSLADAELFAKGEKQLRPASQLLSEL